ncbi:MAG TPA: T9SS type A sorting domain-containing protein, partial [Bacteroidia bacterium]|nr:T9SS type A sorting domain-containing protein [Bacteroidia bacterium]
MKKLLFLLLLLSVKQINAQVSCMLNIKPRIQWPNNNGYCGENSIQACGLYYGNYISEGLCRTVAGGELLLYVNDTTALEAFSFTYKEWNPNANTPQYTTYLNWIKQYLYNKQPVIIAVYVSGMTDPDYDHIIPAIGFKAANVNTYTATDSLTYNSNFDTVPFTRVFSTLYATRAQAGNSAFYPYYIPKDVDYAVAVTGNKDPNHLTKPVHIDLDSNDEPNVSLGANPCVLKATITADSLTPGQSYALLRYNNYQTVPSLSFSPAGANSVVYFTATATTKILADTFMSNTAVFYRCVPYTLLSISALNTQQTISIYPNPAQNNFIIETTNTDKQTLEVFDINGKQVLVQTINTKTNIDVSNLNAGVYNISITSNNGV